MEYYEKLNKTLEDYQERIRALEDMVEKMYNDMYESKCSCCVMEEDDKDIN